MLPLWCLHSRSEFRDFILIASDLPDDQLRYNSWTVKLTSNLLPPFFIRTMLTFVSLKRHQRAVDITGSSDPYPAYLICVPGWRSIVICVLYRRMDAQGKYGDREKCK